MLRILLIVLICFLSLNFIKPEDQGAASSPSPKGDTRMGADATGLGRDLSEDAVQSQEDPYRELNDQETRGDDNPTDMDYENMDVK